MPFCLSADNRKLVFKAAIPQVSVQSDQRSAPPLVKMEKFVGRSRSCRGLIRKRRITTLRIQWSAATKRFTKIFHFTRISGEGATY